VQEVRCKRKGAPYEYFRIQFAAARIGPDVNLDTNSTPAPRTQSTTNNAADTVTLSQSRQVTQLYQQGQQVPQIASTLSLPVDIVKNYLGITKAQ
jgi:DNA-binding NarL/FixJ family response regulator